MLENMIPLHASEQLQCSPTILTSCVGDKNNIEKEGLRREGGRKRERRGKGGREEEGEKRKREGEREREEAGEKREREGERESLRIHVYCK